LSDCAEHFDVVMFVVSASDLSAPVVLIAAMVVGVVVAVALIVLAVRLCIAKRDREQRKDYLQEIDEL
jgi:predicted membrane protein